MKTSRAICIHLAFFISSTPLFASTQNFADESFETFGAGYESSSDTYNVGVNMSNTSTNRAQWNTTGAILNFVQNSSIGGSFPNTAHALDYTSGRNLGNTDFSGFTNNFSWGTVNVNSGNTLNFTAGALYTRVLTLGGGNITTAKAQVALFSGNGKLFYDSTNSANAYLFNDYLLNGPILFGSGGGAVIPVVVLKIKSITRLANGHIVLQCLGTPNRLHTIKYSPDLIVPFAFLGSVTAASDGTFQYEDVNAGSYTKRFYRLTLP